MKKTIIISLIIFAFTFTSCKSEKKEIKQEYKTERTTQLYQCPMDCEKGKSYTEAGTCPVCKMDLKEKKADETKKTDDHSGHGHSH